MGGRSRAKSGGDTHQILVKPPFRLDLTVSALRRTPTNVVDVYTPDGRYLRALDGRTKPVIVSVTQPGRGALSVSVKGSRADIARAVACVRRILGTDRDRAQLARQGASLGLIAPIV